MISSATVVGGGVVGLAMARGLQRLGCDVTVLERSPAPRQEGAGITLWPNALRALDAVAAGDEARSVGRAVRRAVIVRGDGRLLTELPMEALTARHGPLLAVLRSHLTQVLAEGLREPVRYGVEVSVEQGEVLVDGERPLTDLVVGADGIDSRVRRAVLDDVRPRPSGQFAARGVAMTGEATADMVSESWGRGLRFGMVGLRDHLTYWFAVTTTRAEAENLADTFAGWHAPIHDALAAPQVGSTPVLELNDLPRLRTWHDGRSTVLMGDAAHAMTPNLGQGAAQGLEDVAVLLEELGRLPLPQALTAYQGRRKRRADGMVTRSRMAGVLAQGSHPVVALLRDRLTPMAPENMLFHQFSTMIDG